MTTEMVSSLLQKLSRLNWGIVLLIILISAIGWILLISAAGGDIHLWAFKQILRFAVGVLIMFSIALIDLFFIFCFLLICIFISGILFIFI